MESGAFSIGGRGATVLAAVVVVVAVVIVTVVAVLGFPTGALGSLTLVLAALGFEAGALLGLAAFLFEAELALGFFVASPLESGSAVVFALGAFEAGAFNGREAAGVVVVEGGGGRSGGGSKQAEGGNERKQGGFHDEEELRNGGGKPQRNENLWSAGAKVFD